MNNDKYDVIIGLEIHIQSKTQSKMFCPCSTDYFHKEPNTLTCPVCMGMPGALPVPNKRAVELCILFGLATNCTISETLRFDRKHYFYPDLPKGYQISQYDNPICSNGYITVNRDGEDIKIDIERIHQEEDVAKATHHKEITGEEYTLIDYNKSGMPLIEIVTKPTIRNALDAKLYANKIRQIARYLGISDADMEKGQMRCEPNISVQTKGSWRYENGKILPNEGYTLNPKVEVKNIGSISAVEKSIEYEVNRLIEMIENGEKIIQQTRGWNAEKGITEFQRSKESAQDYRYFPDPDIPVITVTPQDIERIREQLVKLPDQLISKYMTDYGLNRYDSEVITENKETAEYFENLLNSLKSLNYDIKIIAKELVNWLTGVMFSIANEKGIYVYELEYSIDSFKILMDTYLSKKITISKAKDLFIDSIKNNKDLSILISDTLSNTFDGDKLDQVINNIINNNTKAVDDYKSGKEASLMFLVGQVMRETKGNTDANTVKNRLIELIK